MDPILITYTAIITMALIPIYIGSQLSIVHKGISLKKNSKNVFEYTQDESEVDSMTSSDAWKFPLIGSAVLFGLYILFKFSKEYINLLLSFYFLLFGVLAVAATVRPVFAIYLAFHSRTKTNQLNYLYFGPKNLLNLTWLILLIMLLVWLLVPGIGIPSIGLQTTSWDFVSQLKELHC